MSGGVRGAGVGLALVAVLAVPRFARSQSVREVSVSVDNDSFAFWLLRRTDWYYTDGQHVEVVGDWSLSGIASLGFHGPSCYAPGAARPCVKTRVRLGQKIFTPENLFFYTPGVVDRPYAGWLYAMFARDRMTGTRTTTAALEVGVTGRPSLAEAVQETLHGMLHRIKPQGWQYQIPFEVAFAASLRDTWSILLTDDGRGLTLALEPHWMATLGTVRTSAEAGYAFRLAWKAPPGFDAAGKHTRDFHFVARLGAEGEAVARDLFLDGSTWKESASVAKKPLVGRTRLSVEVGAGRFDLVLGATRSTREFKTQDVPHLYGTIGLRMRR